MLALKIIGAVLGALLLIIFVILMLRIKVFFLFSTKGSIELKASLLFYKIYDLNSKKKKKKSGRFGRFLKRIFGIDALTDAEGLKTDAQTNGISGTVEKVLSLLFLLAGQIKWLLSRVRLKKLRILTVCGGDDAADAAMEYGAACSVVYPFVGYLDTNFNIKEKAKDINVFCDFEGEAVFETEIIAKIRIIHIVRAVMRNAIGAEYSEEADNEQRK